MTQARDLLGLGERVLRLSLTGDVRVDQYDVARTHTWAQDRRDVDPGPETLTCGPAPAHRLGARRHVRDRVREASHRLIARILGQKAWLIA